MIIAQITDMHIMAEGEKAFGQIDVNANLAAALRHLEAHDSRPDIVLASGDLTAGGAVEEYAAVADILATTELPVYVIPGNHDDRDRIRAALPGHTYLPDGEFLQYVIEGHAVRIVALDTLHPGEIGGALCQTRLDWLKARLEEAPNRPTVIVMHHPPVDCGIEWLDRFGFPGREEMEAMLEKHPQVLRILCGHVHRCIQMPMSKTFVHSASSTAYQFPLEPGDLAPRGWIAEPAGYSLHHWRSDVGLISHTGLIDQYGGRQEFDD